METREYFRFITSYYKKKYNLKNVGSINSIEQGEKVLEEIFEGIVGGSLLKKNEELYSDKKELNKIFIVLNLRLKLTKLKKKNIQKNLKI